MTTTQVNKVNQAILETKSILNNALKYSKDLQDDCLIEYCENHLVKLNNMIS